MRYPQRRERHMETPHERRSEVRPGANERGDVAMVADAR